MEQDIDNFRPYKGVESYTTENSEIFKGRSKEIREMTSLVGRHTVTTFYGAPGVGKTSLLNAGLNPVLIKKGYKPFFLRINFEEGTPQEQIKEELDKVIPGDDIENADDLTLWEYFHRKTINIKETPVLIFDQFEELFTLGKEQIEITYSFIIELSDLIENRVPQSFIDHDIEVPTAFLTKKYKLIFSLREEYLANMDRLSILAPSVLNGRFQLQKMSRTQARDAIYIPAKEKNIIDDHNTELVAAQIKEATKKLYDPAAKSPADQKDDYAADTIILSLYCYQLNEERIKNSKTQIDKDLIRKNPVGNIITKYINESLEKLKNWEIADHFIQDELLNDSGRRRQIDKSKVEKKIVKQDLDILLKERKVLREIGKADGEYIEIIHDRLAKVFFQKKRKRIIDEQEHLKRKRLRLTLIASIIITLIISSFSYVIINQQRSSIEGKERLLAADSLLRSGRIQVLELQDSLDLVLAENRRLDLLFETFGDSVAGMLRNLSSEISSKEKTILGYQRTIKSLKFTSDSLTGLLNASKIKVTQLDSIRYIDSLNLVSLSNMLSIEMQNSERLNKQRNQLESRILKLTTNLSAARDTVTLFRKWQNIYEDDFASFVKSGTDDVDNEWVIKIAEGSKYYTINAFYDFLQSYNKSEDNKWKDDVFVVRSMTTPDEFMLVIDAFAGPSNEERIIDEIKELSKLKVGNVNFPFIEVDAPTAVFYRDIDAPPVNPYSSKIDSLLTFAKSSNFSSDTIARSILGIRVDNCDSINGMNQNQQLICESLDSLVLQFNTKWESRQKFNDEQYLTDYKKKLLEYIEKAHR